MKNKKWYLLMVMMLMGALLLAACGGTEPAEEPAVEEPAVEEETAEEPMEEEAEEPMEEEAEEPMEEPTEEPMEEPTAEPEEEAAAPTVKLIIMADEVTAPVLENLKDSVAEQIGIELEIQQVAFGEIGNQVRVSIPAGEGPDLFITAHDQIGNYIEGGLIAPVDLGDKSDQFVESALNAFSYNGELYGLPYATENVALFRNTELVPEPIETWDDFIAVSQALIDEGTVVNGTVFANTNFHIFGVHTAFGGYIFGTDESGALDPTDVGLDSEGFIASGEFIQQLVVDGIVPAAADGSAADAQFIEGQIPFVINGPWALTSYRDGGVPYSVDPLPTGDAPGAPFLGARGFLVNGLSENALLAQTFLTEFVATEEFMGELFAQDPRIPAFIPTLETVEDEDLAGFAAISPIASPMPNIPEMGAVWDSWGSAVQVIMNGEQTPEEALTNGAEQIREAIASE